MGKKKAKLSSYKRFYRQIDSRKTSSIEKNNSNQVVEEKLIITEITEELVVIDEVVEEQLIAVDVKESEKTNLELITEIKEEPIASNTLFEEDLKKVAKDKKPFREALSLSFKKLLKSKGTKSFSNSMISILFGIIIGFIIIIISNPKNSLQGLARLLFTPFQNSRGVLTGIGTVFYEATPIIFTGLAVAFAFKTGVFNIGASGQYMAGLFAASIVGILGDGLGVFQWPLAVLAGGLAGALWGSIPGLLKAFFNVNVVITGIMLNYIAVFFINGMLGGPLRRFMLDGATNRTIKVRAGARTPYFFLDKIFPLSGVDLSFIIAIILVIVVYIILTKTVFGRELKSVGLNRHAARYAGVNEKYSIIISMTIAGFFAGLGGAFFILAPGARGLGNNYSRENVVLPAGFNGIPVSLLGNNHPIGLFFSALFIAYIQISGLAIQSLGYAKELVDVVIPIILYFSAFSLVVGQFVEKLLRKKREKRKIKILEEEVHL